MSRAGRRSRRACALLGVAGALVAVPSAASAQGTVTQITQASTGKVVSFNTSNLGFLKNYSFTGLLGSDGVVGGGYAFGPPNAAGVASATNRSTANNPYGVAVVQDPTAPDDPFIVTTQTRTGTAAVFKHSANAPTDADVIRYQPDGVTPAFARLRTPRADDARHLALMANYNATTGYVSVIDLDPSHIATFRKVTARLDAPGAVDVAIDQARGLAYVGTFAAPNSGDVLVFDLNAINTSNPNDAELNQPIATIDNPNDNSRPAYDPVLQRVYTANYTANTVSVIDVNPANTSTYRTVIDTIELPDATLGPNAVSVDGSRGRAYVAGLGKQTLTVIRANPGGGDDGDIVLTIPTGGRALNSDVDEDNGRVFVSTMNAGPIHAIDISGSGSNYSATVQDLRTNIVLGYEVIIDHVNDRLYAADAQPLTATRTNIEGASSVQSGAGATGAPGTAGAPGATGPAGPVGDLTVNLSLGQVRVIGGAASVRVPAAGATRVVVKSGSTTIARGSKSSTKAGTIRVPLRKTAAGTRLLRKRAVRATLTATFTPKGKATASSVRAARVKLARVR